MLLRTENLMVSRQLVRYQGTFVNGEPNLGYSCAESSPSVTMLLKHRMHACGEAGLMHRVCTKERMSADFIRLVAKLLRKSQPSYATCTDIKPVVSEPPVL